MSRFSPHALAWTAAPFTLGSWVPWFGILGAFIAFPLLTRANFLMRARRSGRRFPVQLLFALLFVALVAQAVLIFGGAAAFFIRRDL